MTVVTKCLVIKICHFWCETTVNLPWQCPSLAYVTSCDAAHYVPWHSHTMPPRYAVHTTLRISVAQALRFSQQCYWRHKSFGMWHCVIGWLVPDIVKECSASLSERYDPSQQYEYEAFTRHNGVMSQNIRVFWHVTLCQYTSILQCF